MITKNYIKMWVKIWGRISKLDILKYYKFWTGEKWEE